MQLSVFAFKLLRWLAIQLWWVVWSLIRAGARALIGSVQHSRPAKGGPRGESNAQVAAYQWTLPASFDAYRLPTTDSRARKHVLVADIEGRSFVRQIAVASMDLVWSADANIARSTANDACTFRAFWKRVDAYVDIASRQVACVVVCMHNAGPDHALMVEEAWWNDFSISDKYLFVDSVHLAHEWLDASALTNSVSLGFVVEWLLGAKPPDLGSSSRLVWHDALFDTRQLSRLLTFCAHYASSGAPCTLKEARARFSADSPLTTREHREFFRFCLGARDRLVKTWCGASEIAARVSSELPHKAHLLIQASRANPLNYVPESVYRRLKSASTAEARREIAANAKRHFASCSVLAHSTSVCAEEGDLRGFAPCQKCAYKLVARPTGK